MANEISNNQLETWMHTIKNLDVVKEWRLLPDMFLSLVEELYEFRKAKNVPVIKVEDECSLIIKKRDDRNQYEIKGNSGAISHVCNILQENNAMKKWANDRIKEIANAPRMWGGRKAAELQILQLLEMKYLSNASDNNQRLILELHQKYIENAFPNKMNWPLHEIFCDANEEDKFISAMLESIAYIEKTMQ